MKRLIVSLMVVAGALLSACTEEEEFLQTAGLAGTYDVALVSYPKEGAEAGPDLLFVTSADNNELRVLSLEERPEERRFIRAPNPLQPLAIPVLPRPQALTRDVRYDASGNEQTGRLVFARSSGSTQISVVSAQRDVLREVRRMDTTRLTQGASVGPVTAFAARAPEEQGGATTLFFATQETTGARLWSATLPARTVLEGEVGLNEEARTEIVATPLPVLTLPASVAVNALLVMPEPADVPSHPGVLAVATRGAAGTVYRVDLRPVGGGVQELNFGGQVLQLATHGQVDYQEVRQITSDTRREETERVEAGRYLYGILDPSSCGVPAQCTGVLAVDTRTGRVAKDASGRDALGNVDRTLNDMLPLSAGSGLPTGLSVVTQRNLRVQAGEAADRLDPDPGVTATRQRGLTLPLLGIVPLSNGTILFFDALNMLHLNVDAIWASGVEKNTVTSTLTLTNAQGVARAPRDPRNANPDVVFNGTFGVTRDQTYVLTYQGLLPGMASVQRQTDGAFLVPYVPRAGKGPVPQPGDLITLLTAATGGQACATEVRVLSVQAPVAPATQATLVPSGDLPEGCPYADYKYFQVRAGGAQPLVLSSGSEDYLARLGTGGEYSRTGPYFFHPPGYTGLSENLDVRISVPGERLDDPQIGLTRGDRYVVTTDGHFYPYLISVELIGSLFFFRLPGSVVQATVDGVDYAYIAYPSANGVLEVELTNITAGVANRFGLTPFL
ncbi:hypothetical protein ACN28I_11320 [Archangium gephyra]|uniref:hypothetical protein n=1 Tax=Archangium gephyra TaxID=48 RepID=UPI003B7E242D